MNEAELAGLLEHGRQHRLRLQRLEAEGVPNRYRARLARAGVQSVRQLVEMTDLQLLLLPNLGRVLVGELRARFGYRPWTPPDWLAEE